MLAICGADKDRISLYEGSDKELVSLRTANLIKRCCPFLETLVLIFSGFLISPPASANLRKSTTPNGLGEWQRALARQSWQTQLQPLKVCIQLCLALKSSQLVQGAFFEFPGCSLTSIQAQLHFLLSPGAIKGLHPRARQLGHACIIIHCSTRVVYVRTYATSRSYKSDRSSPFARQLVRSLALQPTAFFFSLMTLLLFSQLAEVENARLQVQFSPHTSRKSVHNVQVWVD